MSEMREGDMPHFRIFARRFDYERQVTLLLCKVDWRGRIVEKIGGPLVVVPHEQNTIIEPTLRLEPEQAQELMDELWRCHFRPTEGTGSAGSLAATERHLADMRKLVFEKA